MSLLPVLHHLRRCLGDRRGGTAIEYGLLAALVAMGMIVAIRNLGTSTVAQLNRVEGEVHKVAS